MDTKKIISLLREIEDQLRSNYQDDTLREQYAWWTLQSITGKNRTELLAAQEIRLTSEEQKKLDYWLDKLINEDMPIQYLIGNVPFGELEILVEPPVLIPRPETEEWVFDLIAQLTMLKNQKLTILDVCSGSGCIALALAKALPEAQIFAADIAPHAIALGRKNAYHNKIANVTFVQSDLFDELGTDKLFDLIVSNPPYIGFDEWESIDNSVTTWEDPQALVAGDEGYAIIEQAPDYLQYNKEMEQLGIAQLVVEIGYRQGLKVADFFQAVGFVDVQIHKDLEGKDRVVTGRVGNVVTPFMEE